MSRREVPFFDFTKEDKEREALQATEDMTKAVDRLASVMCMLSLRTSVQTEATQ